MGKVPQRTTILCGVDAAPASGKAAAVASWLSHRLSCDALLVHVERPASSPGGVASIARARERGRLRALVDTHGFPTGTRARIVTGHPTSALLQLARAEDSALLVVGAHGGSDADAPAGPVTDFLTRSAPCPVVVVPPVAATPPGAPGGRLVVRDGRGRDSDARALAADLARRLGAPVEGGAGPLMRLLAAHGAPVVVLPPGADVSAGSGHYELARRAA
jgi:nucleotide-binding universal stress UspA family protein